jgi:carboxypeptidase T
MAGYRYFSRCFYLRQFMVASTLLSGFSLSPAQADNSALPASHRLFRIKVQGRVELIDRLVSKGFDIAGRNHRDGTIDVIAHSEYEARELSGISDQLIATWSLDPKRAPDAAYKSPDEIKAILDDFVAEYPTLAQLESIGKSGEGRDIWALKITQNPDQPDPEKPAILFNAMHHAREVMTPEVALDTIEQLLTRYDSDPKITHWVNTNEIWVVPMLNPDGNQRVWIRNSMWRKNTRGGYGVDINRNYPYGWGSCNGSSGSTGSDTYRGPSAGSEPETQSLMGLVEKIQPVFDISYHSYSELVLYPYGCDGQRAETSQIIEPLGQAMAKALPSDKGSGTYVAGTSWELLYSVDGSDMDWMYHEHHVIPYVIEVNSDSEGFQPAYSWRQPTVEKLRAAWHMLLNRLDQSGMRGLVKSAEGRIAADIPIVVQSTGNQGNTTLIETRTKKNGTFHMIVNPGPYRITFGSGASQITRDVMIGAERVNFNVTLQ